MRKETVIVGASALVILAGTVIYFMGKNAADRQATQSQLDELKRQFQASTQVKPATAAASTGPALLITGVTTQDGSVLAHEKAVREVQDEGFRLLNTRDPKDAAQAAEIFREGIAKVDKTNIFFHSGLGRALLIAGKPAEALQAFQDGRTLDPKNAELVSGMGRAYWNLKDYYHAKSTWEEALALDPASQDALMVMSWVYLALGEDQKAKDGFVALLKIDNTRIEWINGLNMARGNNHDLAAIRSQFKSMPDPKLFLTPPASAPATPQNP